MTRKELRDRQDKYDAFVTKRGETEAKRYLAAHADAPTKGNIRAALAFVLLIATILVIFLSL
jgi:hypothetical protein